MAEKKTTERPTLAEQLEEARTGAGDALKAGALFGDVVREAGVYGIKPDEVAEIRETERGGRE